MARSRGAKSVARANDEQLAARVKRELHNKLESRSEAGRRQAAGGRRP